MMAEGHDVIVCGACVNESAHRCQEIVVTMSWEKMLGKSVVQILLFQGNLMEPVLDQAVCLHETRSQRGAA